MAARRLRAVPLSAGHRVDLMSGVSRNPRCRLPDAQVQVAALLTEQEREVLTLLSQGMTNKEIAVRLSRSPNTIKIHVSHILEKLNLRSRTEAALSSFNFG
jgi:DNA-binding NarL/FixJ family response regulator